MMIYVTFSIFSSCFDLILGVVTSRRGPKIKNLSNLIPSTVFSSRKTYPARISEQQRSFIMIYLTFSIFSSCFDLILGVVTSRRGPEIKNHFNMIPSTGFSSRKTYPARISEQHRSFIMIYLTFSIFSSCFDLILGVVTSRRGPKIKNLFNLIPSTVFSSRKTYPDRISEQLRSFIMIYLTFSIFWCWFDHFWTLFALYSGRRCENLLPVRISKIVSSVQCYFVLLLSVLMLNNHGQMPIFSHFFRISPLICPILPPTVTLKFILRPWNWILKSPTV